jgi:hypothetical protein
MIYCTQNIQHLQPPGLDYKMLHSALCGKHLHEEQVGDTDLD